MSYLSSFNTHPSQVWKSFNFSPLLPQFHKIVACTALFFSILHSCGHLVNFYHVSTQPVENLRCLTQEIAFSSDQKPTVGYWLFQTLTGKFCTILLHVLNYFVWECIYKLILHCLLHCSLSHQWPAVTGYLVEYVHVRLLCYMTDYLVMPLWEDKYVGTYIFPVSFIINSKAQ